MNLIILLCLIKIIIVEVSYSFVHMIKTSHSPICSQSLAFNKMDKN